MGQWISAMLHAKLRLQVIEQSAFAGQVMVVFLQDCGASQMTVQL